MPEGRKAWGRRRFYPKKKPKDTPINPKNSSNTLSPSIHPELQNNNIQKPPESPEEIRIANIAQDAYQKALEQYYFPSIPDPNFIFDYSKTTGFFINMETYQVTLNLANTPNIHLDQEFFNYYFMLSTHEIGHYDYCPYDNATNLRLIAAAIEGGLNKYFAPIVVNIFADLLIDTRTHEKFQDLMEWELAMECENTIRTQPPGELSYLWKLITRCYEILWKFNATKSQVDLSEIESYAKNVVKTILPDMKNEVTWEQKVTKLAKILKDLLKSECTLKQQSNNSPSQRQISNYGQGPESFDQLNPEASPLQVPQDVETTFGDLTEIRNPDTLRSGGASNKKSQGPEQSDRNQAQIEELAEELNFRTFADTLSLNGLTNSFELMRMWYRGQAKNLIRIQIFDKHPGGAIPSYPVTWRIGDSIEDLDIVQSMLVSPIIIPNLTTRKWIQTEGPGQLISRQIPDMMLVIDSSGSMDWNIHRKKVSGRYHVSLLAAFAALHYAIQHGSYVAGINFSSAIYTQSWTNDVQKIERLLLQYQGNGTIMPNKKILDLAKEAEKPSLILIISDLEMDNWAPTKQTFLDLIQRKHKIIAFFIEGDEDALLSKDFQELIELGAKFYCIQNMNDLVGLVLTEIELNYE